MSQVWLIAARELRGYFNGLSGYVILAAHLLITGILFNVFAVGDKPRYSQEVLGSFFYFSSGMAIITALLISLRLVAEERQLQTLVLLRTAPISERQIIWGKYLSALLFFSLTLVLSVYMPALVMVEGKITVGQIITGYLGLFLLGSACIAITLLASVWSPTQLVAGVVAGVLVTLLLVAWMMARVTDEPMRSLFSYLALHNLHFTTFSSGVLNLRDVVYYLGLTLFFLEAAISSLESWRWRE